MKKLKIINLNTHCWYKIHTAKYEMYRTDKTSGQNTNMWKELTKWSQNKGPAKPHRKWKKSCRDNIHMANYQLCRTYKSSGQSTNTKPAHVSEIEPNNRKDELTQNIQKMKKLKHIYIRTFGTKFTWKMPTVPNHQHREKIRIVQRFVQGMRNKMIEKWGK